MAKNYPLLRNPWIWLRRFRQRCGYGVHSPFAFDFITGVVYERSMYYAFKELDAQLPWYVSRFGLRPRKLLRLLFRVANFAEPRRALFLGGNALAYSYLRAASQTAEWTTEVGAGEAAFDLIYIDKEWTESDTLPQGRVIIVDHLREHRGLWQAMKVSERTTLTFDLYDIGIVMQGLPLNKMNYIVNF